MPGEPGPALFYRHPSGEDLVFFKTEFCQISVGVADRSVSETPVTEGKKERPRRGFQKFLHMAASKGTTEEGNWMKFSTSNFLACPLSVMHSEYCPSARILPRELSQVIGHGRKIKSKF